MAKEATQTKLHLNRFRGSRCAGIAEATESESEERLGGEKGLELKVPEDEIEV